MLKFGDGVLHALRTVLHQHRVADVLDTDLVDGDVPDVRLVLHVGDFDHFRLGCL